MVMKMFATATTGWPTEIAMVNAVAVYATRITVNMYMKNADGVDLNPTYTHMLLLEGIPKYGFYIKMHRRCFSPIIK